MTTDLYDQIEMFLTTNFPQIPMHGGAFTIEEVDAETGAVSIRLTDACDGCGLSPMTITAIQRRMTEQIDQIESVDVTLGEAHETDAGEVPF